MGSPRTSRTGTAAYFAWRSRVLARGQAYGVVYCPECSVLLDYRTTRLPNSAEPDHIVPDALGGGLTLDNGRVICRRCNARRGKRPIASLGGTEPRPKRPHGVGIEW